MRLFGRVFTAVLLILPSAVSAQLRSRRGIETDLLYDATATFDRGVEFRTAGETSSGILVNYNPWTINYNRKWKHIMMHPEFRLWVCEVLYGHSRLIRDLLSDVRRSSTVIRTPPPN